MWAYLCARAKAGQLEDYGAGRRVKALISVPSRPDRDGWHLSISKRAHAPLAAQRDYNAISRDLYRAGL